MTAPDRMNISEYARRRDVSRTAVQKAIKSGRLVASITRDAEGRVSIDAAVADQEWASKTDHGKAPTAVMARGLAVGDVPADPADGPEPDMREGMSLADAAKADKYWSAMRRRLDYQERANELVSAKDVAAETIGLFTRCRTKLLGIPSKAKAAMPGLTQPEIAILDRLLREALEELSGPSEAAA